MSFSCFVKPELVRVMDTSSGPIDVWKVEFPFWLAKHICELKEAQNYQQIQPPFSVYNFPQITVTDTVIDENETVIEEESACAVENPTEIQSCFTTETVTEEQIVCVEHIVEMEHPYMNASYVMQHANFIPCEQNLQDAGFLVWADLKSEETILPQYQNSFNSSGSQLSPYCNMGNQFLPENLLYAPCLPPVPAAIQFPQFQYLENSSVATIPDNLLIHTSKNGSFFMENEQSQTSGFVSSSLQDWGFSHPLGEVLKSRRGTNCCFLLHSGSVCYVKFCPQGIKFSSNQSGVSYLIDEAGVRTCWESFRTYDEIKYSSNGWKTRTRGSGNSSPKPCYCGEATCFHQRLYQQVMWDSNSKDDTIRIERKGLRFFSETRELKNLNLSLEDNYLSATP